MKKILFSVFDPEWDGGDPTTRWQRWRPTVSLMGHDDLPIDRLELIVQASFRDMAELAIEDMQQLSPHTDIRVHLQAFRDPWDFEEMYGALYDIVEQEDFQPEHNEYLVHMSTGTHVSRICLFLLCESHIIPGKMLQSYPPNTQGQGSDAGWRTIDLALGKYDRLAKRFERRKAQGQWFLKSGIATENVAFNQTIEEIEQVAIHSQHPILLTGPTGAGKSVLARRIYELKQQRHQINGDFVPVNCATLRGDGAMSTLFGHQKGAFTGATSQRPGLLKAADNGLLFLDEIGELGLEEQAMLLTALESGRFYPVGADKESSSNFQLIAGTNRYLQTQVSKGLFREDLLARINLWHFDLPGLKQRQEDIAPNIGFELDKFATRAGKQVSFNKEAHASYLKFSLSHEAKWQGNFRDLNASITRMATLADNGRIAIQDVEKELKRLKKAWQNNHLTESSFSLSDVMPEEKIDTLDLFDRKQLEHVITECRKHPTAAEAGRALFSVSRTQRKTVNDSDRLRKYLGKFGLSWGDVR